MHHYFKEKVFVVYYIIVKRNNLAVSVSTKLILSLPRRHGDFHE